MQAQPHILITKGQIPPVVLVCGDPARAEDVAKLMESSVEIAYNREYRTFCGTYHGCKIAVTSHGVGAAGAGICFEELINVGARIIIRLGTCGALQDDLKQGDHIVVSAAVREDGISGLLIPPGYPAVASTEAVVALEKVAAKMQLNYSKGIALSTDLFYPGIVPTSLETYQKAGVLAVEMECAALFVIGGLKKIITGALLTVDGNPLKWQEGDYAPHSARVAAAKEKMLRAGLETAAFLSDF